MDKRSKAYKVQQYGGEEAYSEEMSRRAAMRKTIAPGKPFTPETAQQAIKKRWGKLDGRSSNS
jgi:hypothetical protein